MKSGRIETPYAKVATPAKNFQSCKYSAEFRIRLTNVKKFPSGIISLSY